MPEHLLGNVHMRVSMVFCLSLACVEPLEMFRDCSCCIKLWPDSLAKQLSFNFAWQNTG